MTPFSPRTIFLAAGAAIGLALAAPAFAQAAPQTPYRQSVVALHTATGRSVATLVTTPPEGMNLNAPVIIHCHGGPGASPLDGSGPWIAAGLAQRGYTIVAPTMAHGERLYDTDFSDYSRDVKAVVDYVAGLGFKQIVLTGSSFGSITITRYMVDTQDARITALIHFAPTEDTGRFTLRGMGEEQFYKQNMAAADMIAKGKTDEVFGPMFVAPAPMKAGTRVAFMSTPDRWQTMWGIGYGANNLGLFPKIKLPMLLAAGEKDGYSTRQRMDELKAAATGSPRTDILWYPGDVDHSFNSNPSVQPKVIADVAVWLADNGLGIAQPVRTEVFTITDTEPGTRALRYVPAGGARPGVAFLAVHDFDGSPMTGPASFLAEGAAQAGNFAVAPAINRGTRGMTSGTYAGADKDIGNWIDYLGKHGYAKVVLVGHGFGATRAAHYIATKKDPRVVGLVMAAPAPDSAAFMRERIGATDYDAALDKARAKPARDDYRDFVYLKHTPAGVPNDMNGGELVMTPAAFLDAWGPDAPVVSRMVGKLGVPVLVLAGDKDERLAAAGIERLKAGGKSVTLIRYDGADTELTGSEVRATRDMLRWAADRKLVAPPSGPFATSVPMNVPAARTGAASPHQGGVAGTPETTG